MLNEPINPAQYPRHYHLRAVRILTPVMSIILTILAIVLTEPALDDLFWWYAAVMTSLAGIGSMLLALIRCSLYVDKIE